MNRYVMVFVAAHALIGCDTAQESPEQAAKSAVPVAKVVFVGTYAVKADAPAGSVGERGSSSYMEFQKDTALVVATPGTRFGIVYVVEGPPTGKELRLRTVWRSPVASPPPEESEKTCHVGNECFAGLKVDPNGVESGTWTLEIWLGERRLIRQLYDVVQPDERRQSLAARLVASTDYGAVVAEAIRRCKDSSVYGSDARAFFRANPAVFGGITPQSAAWPEAEAIVARYQAAVCHANTVEDYTTHMADQYAYRLSAEDLQEVSGFLSTPAGKRYLGATADASSEQVASMQRKMMRAYRRAAVTFGEEVQALVSKPKQSPK